MLLVGSKAINEHIPGFRKEPRDVDYLCTPVEALTLASSKGSRMKVSRDPYGGPRWFAEFKADGTQYDLEIAKPGTAARNLLEREEGTASLDTLYMLKLSHRYLKNSPHFLKTMLDIRTLRAHGAKVSDPAWLKWRENETYTYKHPKLKQGKESFFSGDGVKYVYDHDSIHQAVKLGPIPAYQMFGMEGEQVYSCKESFFKLSEQGRINAVLEETYVLALERSQIPFGDRITPEKSFRIALEKVCTSITSGWFREYAWENFFQVVAQYNPNYVQRLKEGVAKGTVLPFNNEVQRAY